MMNLLFVNSEWGNLSSLKQNLRQSGFTAHALWSRQNPKKKATSPFSGLILVALSDPTISQYRIMQKIRAIESFSLAPIIFCNCNESPENLAQVLSADGQEFLPPDVTYPEMVNILGDFLMARAA